MPVVWDEVQKALSPIPNFEDLIKRMEECYRYSFIARLYNISLADASAFLGTLLHSDPRKRYEAWAARLAGTFRGLEGTAPDMQALVAAVHTRAKFEAFVERSGVGAMELIELLKAWLYRVLPSKYYLKEISDESEQDLAYADTLRKMGVRFNLDLLENFYDAQKRRALVEASGVPLAWIDDMLHRADFSRMAYTRGASVRNFFHAGYNTLAKLAAASPEKLTEDMVRYGKSVGMNFKHGMEFDSSIEVAKLMPKLLDEKDAK